MDNLLFLVHRIPFPPNKGDKIRSYHFLKYLAERYQIYLGTFIDDAHDWQYTADVDALCVDTCYQALQSLPAKLKSLQGLLAGQALSLPYYQNPQLQTWVDNVIEKHAIRKVLIFSSVMARFIRPTHDVDMVVDFVDVDSDKWRQYAENKQGIAKWIYQREARYLLSYEKELASRAQASLFVSEQEALLFKNLSPNNVDKIGFVNNGVDTVFFSPEHELASPYQIEDDILVFTGAMDYWANVDAVVWFAKLVFPLVLAEHPTVKFFIVGSKPSKEVLSLAENPAITVTGRVDDIRPYTAHASLVVAPLRIARGIQNKVLEAMAMAKTVVASTAAMEGIADESALASLELAVIDDADLMAQQIITLLKQPCDLASANRDFVVQRFSWQQNVHKLAELL